MASESDAHDLYASAGVLALSGLPQAFIAADLGSLQGQRLRFRHLRQAALETLTCTRSSLLGGMQETWRAWSRC